jgi:hypothetical protein
MYCPACGSEERQLSQYCRACGTDLRAVRITLERPDAITASAVSARDEIGRAVAEKIRQTSSAKELHKVAEDVLPEIEKFLESPDERRLRRFRAGIIVACIGLGACLGGLAVSGSVADKEIILVIIPGLVAFFIGLGILLNGLLFTVPRKQLADQTDAARSQQALDNVSSQAAFQQALPSPDSATNELELNRQSPPSITENTTHQLKVDR